MRVFTRHTFFLSCFGFLFFFGVLYAATPVLGPQRVGVIMMYPSGYNISSLPSVQDMYKRIFEGVPQAYYKENSYGKMWLQGDVYGWYPVGNTDWRAGVSGDARSKEYDAAVARNLGKSLDEVFARDPNLDVRKYLRLVVIVPTGGSYGWFGNSDFPTEKFGVFSGSVHVMSVGATLAGWNVAFSHEFGHQLGLGHANGYECGDTSLGFDCSITDYANHFDIMGAPGSASPHMNAYFKNLLGWVSEDEGSLISIATPGTYALKPIERNGAVVAKVVSRDRTYYLEYRQPVGFDAILGDELIEGRRRNLKRDDLSGIFINIPVRISFSDMIDTAFIDTLPNDENRNYCTSDSPYYPVYCEDWDSVSLLPGRTFSDGYFAITNLGESGTGNEKQVRFSVSPASDAAWCFFADVNHDGRVGISDLVSLARYFGEGVRDESRFYDLNSDGVIDIVDLVLIAKHFGEECSF